MFVCKENQICFDWFRMRAEFYIRIAKSMPELFELVGTLIRDFEKGKAFSNAFHVPVVNHLDDLLALNPDFVVVATKRGTMKDYLLRLFRLQMPVLCETPPGETEEDLLLLTGETDLQRGSLKLGNSGASLVLVSLGAKGAFFRKNGLTGRIPTYDVKTIDTNGAGDAFLGAVLYCLRKCSLEEIRALSNTELTRLVSFANAAGALATSKNGAIPSMPTLEEIESCRKNIPLLN